MLVVSALMLGAAVFTIADALREWSISDMDAYWMAALRLRSGQPLYQLSYSVGAHDLYKYAPWFAFVWVPLTYLPRSLVAAFWTAILLVATGAAVWPTAARRTLSSVILAVFFGSFLVWNSAKGNVQPLMIAMLVYGLRGRGGPLAIALATSLKAAPVALVAIYIGRRQWRNALSTAILVLVLAGPMLLFDLRGYERNPGISLALYYPLGASIWIIVAASAFLIAILLARRRWAWLAAVAAVIAAFPRLLTYDASILLIPTSQPPGAPAEVNGGAAIP
jgi:hypothetical protein